MSLKGCIKKAGKNLDVDDRKYMTDLMAQGRPDQEVLNRLEQNIIAEQSEVIQLLETQGVEVVSLGESLTSRGEEAPTGAAEPGEVKVSSKEISSTVAGDKAEVPPPTGRKSSTESSSGDPGGASVSGSSTNPKSDKQSGDSQSAKPLKEGLTTGGASTAPTDQAPVYFTEKTAGAVFEKLAESSSLIARFLKTSVKDTFFVGIENLYWPDRDEIHVTGVTKGKERLNMNDPKDFAKMKQAVEHEVLHANTVGYLVKQLSEEGSDKGMKDILYLGKAITELRTARDNGTLNPDIISSVSNETQSRIDYIVGQSNMERSIAEFIAVMGAETATSKEIMEILGRRQGLSQSAIKSAIERIVERVKKWFDSISDADLKKDLDIEKLSGALVRTIEQGREFREQQYQENKRYAGQMDHAFGYNSKTTGVNYARKASFDYLNYAVSTMVNSKLEARGKSIMGNLHGIMVERFPMYAEAADKAVGIYDSSPALQQFIHTVTGENVNKMKKADVLSKFAAINSQKSEITNEQTRKMQTLSKGLSDTEKKDLNVFVSQLPLHDYFVGDPEGRLTTAESIEAEAELLRKKLWKVNMRAVRDAEQLIDWNIGIRNPETGKLEQKDTGTIYNLDTKYPMNGDFAIELRTFLALESIKRYGAKKFEKLLKNEELFEVIKDNSVANAINTLDMAGNENIRDSLVNDYFDENFRLKVVRKKDFRMYEFGEETGWKILKAPTKTELGIVYQPVIDATDIAGAYTDIKMGNTDVNVDEQLKRFPGVVESSNGYKLRLTQKQKKELGLIEDFAVSLARSTAHSSAMKESEIIRNAVLQDDTWRELNTDSNIQDLKAIVESDNVDNPWFLKLGEDVEYNKLPKEIQAKYQPVGSRASNLQGFNEKVDLVRKDISHWLLGGKSSSLFQNPKMRWAIRILKNLISGAKIGMVVLNPVKIANDNLSNLTYLGVMGVDPLFISKNYAEITKDFAEYSQLKKQVVQTKLQLVARPDSTKLQKQLKSLQKRIDANSVGDIEDKGFVNSLGSDLVSRSADTLSGFQADMHKALDYLLTDKKGNRNLVSHFIIQLQKVGFQGEDFIAYLGDLAGKAESTTILQQELDQVAARLREIKSEEDVVNYVSQITTSPSSEAVRFGSAMTDLTDVLAKETLYRHSVENKGMSPDEARIFVLDSFPDYKENMPLSIKQLSDIGIIMFPSFWLRIQKVIYRMMRDKPVSLATELMIQDMLGTDVNTIFEANVINKSNTFGGLLHTPFEPIGANSVIPDSIFG